MYRHVPSRLKGSVSRTQGWWVKTEIIVVAEETPADHPPLPDEQGGIRLELVRRIRREIAAGEYDTPEKWELALERLGAGLGLR